MKKIDALIDTDIFLDVFLEREGFYDASRTVLKLYKEHAVNGFLTAPSITDIFYILRKGLHMTAAVHMTPWSGPGYSENHPCNLR